MKMRYSKPPYKVNGGVYSDLERSKRAHPTYKAPVLVLVKTVDEQRAESLATYKKITDVATTVFCDVTRPAWDEHIARLKAIDDAEDVFDETPFVHTAQWNDGYTE